MTPETREKLQGELRKELKRLIAVATKIGLDNVEMARQVGYPDEVRLNCLRSAQAIQGLLFIVSGMEIANGIIAGEYKQLNALHQQLKEHLS